MVVAPSKVGKLVRVKKFKKKTTRNKIKTEISRYMNKFVEKKFFDTINSGTVTNVSAVNKLSSVAQSTGASNDNTRIGDKLTLQNVQYALELNAVNANSRIRITVFRWNRDDGQDAPTSAKIYQNIGACIQSPFNFDSLRKGDFTILHDRCFNLILNNDNALRQYRKVLKVKSAINFVANSINGEGHIYSILTSTGVPTITEYARVKFTDM